MPAPSPLYTPEDTIAVGTALGVATRHVPAQHPLRDCTEGVWPEDRRLRWAPVALKRLRRGQLALVGPPAAVQLYKLPSLFGLASRRSYATPFGHLVQSSSASRFTAGASGFWLLSQSGERPERYATPCASTRCLRGPKLCMDEQNPRQGRAAKQNFKSS